MEISSRGRLATTAQSLAHDCIPCTEGYTYDAKSVDCVRLATKLITVRWDCFLLLQTLLMEKPVATFRSLAVFKRFLSLEAAKESWGSLWKQLREGIAGGPTNALRRGTADRHTVQRFFERLYPGVGVEVGTPYSINKHAPRHRCFRARPSGYPSSHWVRLTP